jgi:hypothetical protein
MSTPTINASMQLALFMAGYRIHLVIDIFLAPPRSLPGRNADVHYYTKDAKADRHHPRVARPSNGRGPCFALVSNASIATTSRRANRYASQMFAR